MKLKEKKEGRKNGRKKGKIVDEKLILEFFGEILIQENHMSLFTFSHFIHF